MNITNSFMAWVHTRFCCKIKGENNAIIKKAPIKISDCRIRLSGKNNKIIFEPGVSMRDTKIVMSGENNTMIFGRNATLFGKGEILMYGTGGTLSVGAGAILDEVLLWAIDSCDIIIGESTMIGRNTNIRTSDSHPIYDLETGERINYPKSINIGNHVWIGAYARIMKGAVIEDGSMVGIGSLVTRTVEKNTLVGGAPARKLRSGIRWER